jgi:fluoride exporter
VQEVYVSYLIVFIGSGIGGMLRHGVNVASAHLVGHGIPFSTLVVNLLGSLLMGLLVGFFAFKGHGDHGLRLFLATGVLGGFTTFSSFSLDAVTLYRRGEILAAVAYATGSVVVSLGALALGLFLVRRLI